MDNLFDIIKVKILELAKEKLQGYEKKKILDDYIIAYLVRMTKKIDFPGVDAIYDTVFTAIYNGIIPIITEQVYQILKVKGDID